MAQRERVALYIHQDGAYLPRLLQIFHDLEKQRDEGSLTRDAADTPLSHLFAIMKHLIMMNDMTLVVDMMSDAHFWGVLGCLEYDPELEQNARHRHFMQARNFVPDFCLFVAVFGA